ncbi:uncharacterized protein PADG_07122 [Paracoccidioides brasiliensis Pb18]|uniref:Tf2-1-like SH3-like domain-containing protein n=1 Tax=Paracoccidioides brasiliensis (strain Pb18) TaxID=502780 RepID=C1GIN6_PARBD|nr:uncharacterized protein PADG_07122 [Paracoccidioides brasiliensis Pb18]EEH42302.2 hypothetical protein PADG_07122 [Paracoccidioides brasiliensis Pb18]
MEEIWKLAADNVEKAQGIMKSQASKHRRELNFGVGGKVFLSFKNYRIQRPSRKHADQSEGPFEIIEKIGNSYKLELPDSMKIHPVFSPDKLRKAADNPLPGQVNVTPDPVKIEGEMNGRLRRCSRAASPGENFNTGQDPKRLSNWLEAWEKDDYLADEADDFLRA